MITAIQGRVMLFANLLLIACLLGTIALPAQQLDLSRTLPLTAPHPPLPEQYIWTASDITAQRPDHNKFPWNRPDLRATPHLFRTHFHLDTLPKQATLYLAGPREAHVFLNGKPLGDFQTNLDAPINFHVFHADASSVLKKGDNVLAIQAIRGRGVVSVGNSLATAQLAYGEVLAAKILPAPPGIEAPALVLSDTQWRSIATPAGHWNDPAFDDSAWPLVASLGSIEGDPDLRQWSADAGMYGWPGYLGLSPALRTYAVRPVAVTHVFSGHGTFQHLEALTAGSEGFAVALHDPSATDSEAPSLLLDFGREIAGRLLIEGATNAIVSVAYGESEIEALATGNAPGQQGGNYLGTNLLEVPAGGIARGPKSGFRYARIQFLRGAPITSFKSIRAEGIDYPVDFAGSFESSDPLLNRIWETGAYTAHLCMQDGIWDAPKRDRGRWVGDMDIEGRVISTAFGDKDLMEETLSSLAGTGTGHINGIPSYSALWITTIANFYQHSGDLAFLRQQREPMLRILAAMDADIDPGGAFRNTKHRWLFVDWSPGLYAYTDAARIGTALQFVRGYRAAASLFGELGDNQSQKKYLAQADKVLAAVHQASYGPSWQINALAVLTEPEAMHAALWSEGLAHIQQDAPTDPVISPYFNTYVLDALARTGHHRQALDWIRTYWGGMLAEGATTFWESYDLRWPRTNPHLSLQADGTSGFFVSMAHGWSAGPTAWLSENVLGITPASPGYRTVAIRPNLMGLAWAQGSVPTPHGPITLRIDPTRLTLTLPPGIEQAVVTLPSGRDLIITGPGEHRIDLP